MAPMSPRTGPTDLADLWRRLIERTLEHGDPSLLLRTAVERLKSEELLRPGLWLMERLVAEGTHCGHGC